jgi:hypothetical protein
MRTTSPDSMAARSLPTSDQLPVIGAVNETSPGSVNSATNSRPLGGVVGRSLKPNSCRYPATGPAGGFHSAGIENAISSVWMRARSKSESSAPPQP